MPKFKLVKMMEAKLELIRQFKLLHHITNALNSFLPFCTLYKNLQFSYLKRDGHPFIASNDKHYFTL